MDNVRARSGTVLWLSLIAALVVAPNLFAFRQYVATGGYLFYANAFDEATYLSYDGARLTASLTHLAEYPVLVLHALGLSGGFVNLLFDLVCPVLLVILLRNIGRSLGFSPAECIVYPFFIVSFPVLLGYANPYYTYWYNLNYQSSGLSWITLPQGYYPPYFRTPEPQLSLVLAALATWLALRWRSFLVAFAVAPLLYPFVGIPYTFVVVALFTARILEGRIQLQPMRAALALLAGYAVTTATITVFYVLFVSRTTLADFLPITRLPLVSGTGVAALAVYAIARRRLDAAMRLPALAIAAAPLAIANTQLVSGFLQTPHNVEQNFGVVALGIVLTLAIRTLGYPRVWIGAAALASVAMLALYASHIDLVNASLWQRTPVPDSLADALQREPESVVVGDPTLADLFAMMHPRGRFSALAHSQTLRTPIDDGSEGTTSWRFQNYLCVRQLVSRADPAAVNPDVFRALDRSFRYLNQDFLLIHLNRKSQFRQYFDPDAAPQSCRARPLTVFPHVVVGEGAGGRRVLDDLRAAAHSPDTGGAMDVQTPAARWAYAATHELPSLPSTAGRVSALAALRVRMTVTEGCVGVNVVTPDQKTFVATAALGASETPHTADLIFETGAQPNWMVLNNCSPEGASAASIESIELFPVEQVTVRTIAAAP